MSLPSTAEVGHALANLENYRVLRVQEKVFKIQGGWSPFAASLILALGFRESSLRNVCGGARWNGTEWVQAYSDRGWVQIADTIDTNAKWLRTQEGCAEGTW